MSSTAAGTQAVRDDLRPLSPGLAKAPTGIKGFDEVTGGGLPRGRPTLVTGAAGSGKSLFGMEFLVRGAREFDEPGVLLSFEESAADIAANVASLGFDLAALQRERRLVVDAFRVDPAEIVTTGAFDLDGLFLRLAGAVDEIGAKRVVVDTVEVLFTALGNEGIVRGELGRLFRWMKDRGLTAVVTGERGREGQLTRFGIEEYVSDCVVVLDQRVSEDIATRRLRIAKYRGSAHHSDEYPFLITDRGLTVLPLTSVGLAYGAPMERVSTGMPDLDEMVGGGVYRGSAVLVSGSAGTGKTTIAAKVVDAACARGERALLVSFEESPEQLVRNMRSVGVDLGHWRERGLLTMWSERATTAGMEEHLGRLERLLDDTQPSVVALDGLASLTHAGGPRAVTATVTREMDLLKVRGITSVLTALSHELGAETSSVDVSSFIDTWLLLRNVETDGERNRLLFVIKSRGGAHSNQVREFVITSDGPKLVEVFVGPRGVLTGSARVMAQAEEQAAAMSRSEDLDERRRALGRRSAEVAGQVSLLREQLAVETAAVERLAAEELTRAARLGDVRAASVHRRSVAGGAPADPEGDHGQR